MPVRTGLDRLERCWPRQFYNARVGLLMHPASVDRKLRHAVDCFRASKRSRLTALFGPQHGIRGETQDNMVQWEGFLDRHTSLPVYSLYGRSRKPEPAMLRDIDVIAVDLQDVGARYYTFIWTLELCMQACAVQGKAVIILDRPNPIGGVLTEGPVLKPFYASFVGLRPLPVRHGMTIAEIGNYLRDAFYPKLDLSIIKMQGWKRSMWYDATNLPWVLPSPNMPTPDTATVYPGMCLLEGTMLSEGRGTTRPFEIFGAPFVEPDILVKQLNQFRLPGVVFRPLYFQPTFQKHAGRLCGGAQIHVTERQKFKPFKTGVAVLKAVRDLYPAETLWRQPPYEYETEKMPIDILAGTDQLRHDIEKGVSLDIMEQWWREQCRWFEVDVKRNFLLYE